MVANQQLRCTKNNVWHTAPVVEDPLLDGCVPSTSSIVASSLMSIGSAHHRVWLARHMGFPQQQSSRHMRMTWRTTGHCIPSGVQPPGMRASPAAHAAAAVRPFVLRGDARQPRRRAAPDAAGQVLSHGSLADGLRDKVSRVCLVFWRWYEQCFLPRQGHPVHSSKEWMQLDFSCNGPCASQRAELAPSQSPAVALTWHGWDASSDCSVSWYATSSCLRAGSIRVLWCSAMSSVRTGGSPRFEHAAPCRTVPAAAEPEPKPQYHMPLAAELSTPCHI
jgi:hypothetical protein